MCLKMLHKIVKFLTQVDFMKCRLYQVGYIKERLLGVSRGISFHIEDAA